MCVILLRIRQTKKTKDRMETRWKLNASLRPASALELADGATMMAGTMDCVTTQVATVHALWWCAILFDNNALLSAISRR